jgi:hypothetical protein
MKNIFLVQTDKPSRLVKIKDTFFLTSTDDIPGGTFYNISITNTEEIKEGYYLDLTHNIVMKSVFYPSSDKNCKKIILTDDPDLIKDGVQAIDDDFLEWFVQNSDCEEVEVKWVKTPDGIFYHKDNVPYGYYKIIIPKEELSKDEIDKFFVDMVCNPKEEPKQETLEETAEKFLIRELNLTKIQAETLYSDYIKAVVKFHKWQQEQDKNKYSEEDLMEAYMEGGDDESIYKTFYQWFENFKNK